MVNLRYFACAPSSYEQQIIRLIFCFGGISSPALWASSVIFLLLNVHGGFSFLHSDSPFLIHNFVKMRF